MEQAAASSSQRQRLRQANSNDIPTAAKISLTHEERNRAAADIKRELHERTKNDWESEWAAIVRKTPLARRAGDDNDEVEDGDGDSGGDGDDGSNKAVVDDDGTGPALWQEREFSSSPCPSPTPSVSEGATLSAAATPGLKSSQTGEDGGQPPATHVNVMEADQAREERLKRRRLLEEEMSWNTGLRYWMMQRDAWCGARLRHIRHSPSSAAPRSANATTALDDNDDDGNNYSGGDGDDDVTTVSSADDVAMDHSPPPSPIRNGQWQWRRRRRRRQQQQRQQQQQRPVVDVIEEAPIAPPLFSPSNPLRAGITPALYPQIYSKFVIKSQTPIVPINLAHMLRAIVAGWQSEGVWSARAASDPQHASNMDDTSTTAFVSAAAAAREPHHGFLPATVRRPTHEGNRGASRWLMNGGGRKGSLDEAKNGERSASARPRRLAMSRGVGAVKKVLGLVGTSRGGTHNGHHDDHDDQQQRAR